MPSSEGVQIVWSNLTFSVAQKKLLRNIYGEARPGRLLAVMGPSGCGKTTMINAIAGKIKATPKAQLTGELRVNGRVVGGSADAADVQQAYVQQEDTFYTQMTVRETLMFAAKLRLPREMPTSEKEATVDALITKLSLVKVADTLVGDAKRRGISGGERKRLAIGCELLGNPNLLFLDEPTSGLDSFQAQKVVETLQTLAAEGCTVIMAIHQPRSSIFRMFDDLLLLSEGRKIYQGPARHATKHFARLGYPLPSGVSAAEHVVDLVSADYRTSESLRESLSRIESLADQGGRGLTLPSASRMIPAIFSSADQDADYATVPEDKASKTTETKATKASTGSTTATAAAAAPPPPRRRRTFAASRLTQFKLLFRRSWREVARSRATLGIKVAQQLMIAAIYGNIYNLDDSQRSIQDRFGLISLVAIGAGNLAIASTVRTFPKEKAIVLAERAKNIYGVLPYFAAKVLAEAPVSAAISALGGAALYPFVNFRRSLKAFGAFCGTLCLEGLAAGGLGLFLGAAAPSTDVALALFPPVLVLMIIFNGFNIAEASTPKLLRWVPKISLIRWCSEALAVNEFTGLKFTPPPGASGPSGRAWTETGAQALERVSFQKSTVRRAALAQSAIVAGSYVGSYAFLQKNRPRFLSVVPPVGC